MTVHHSSHYEEIKSSTSVKEMAQFMVENMNIGCEFCKYGEDNGMYCLAPEGFDYTECEYRAMEEWLNSKIEIQKFGPEDFEKENLKCQMK